MNDHAYTPTRFHHLHIHEYIRHTCIHTIHIHTHIERKFILYSCNKMLKNVDGNGDIETLSSVYTFVHVSNPIDLFHIPLFHAFRRFFGDFPPSLARSATTAPLRTLLELILRRVDKLEIDRKRGTNDDKILILRTLKIVTEYIAAYSTF